MTKYTFSVNISQNEYDEFVKASSFCTLLQSYHWAKIKSNWDHLYTGVYDENHHLCATGLVLIKRLPASFCMFYIPRGPIMDYQNVELLDFYFKSLKKEAKKNHCLFIKFDPPVHVNDYYTKDYNENRYPEALKVIENLKTIGCKHHGFTKLMVESAQPRYQSTVYACDDIEAAMPKHTKRLIKDADRRNVEILTGGSEFIDEFSRLVSMTEERKHVSLRNKNYFKLLMDTYGEDAVIFLAEVNLLQLDTNAHNKKEELLKQLKDTPEEAKNKIRTINDQLTSTEKDITEFDEMLKEVGNEDENIAIAGILSIQYGNTCEMLYAGMDERFKKFMPQYKEYVANFKWAFDRGCQWASMGGIEGTLDDGLTKFKDNFNPMINEFIGEFDYPVSALLSPLALKAYNYMKQRHSKE